MPTPAWQIVYPDITTRRIVRGRKYGALAVRAQFGFTCIALAGRLLINVCPSPSQPSLPSGLAAHAINPRLTRAEFWLLNRVAVFGRSLRALEMTERPPAGPPWGRTSLEEHYNCRGHGLAPRAFARCLHGGMRKGWIQLWRDGSSVEGLPSLSETWSWLSEPGLFAKGVYAGLTTLGGEVWVAFARPEWDRYIFDCMTFEDDTETELREATTLDLAWLRRYQDTVRADQSIDLESTFEIADWELTYWKPPVAGYRWTFRAQGPRRPVEKPSHYLQSLWCEWSWRRLCWDG